MLFQEFDKEIRGLVEWIRAEEEVFLTFIWNGDPLKRRSRSPHRFGDGDVDDLRVPVDGEIGHKDVKKRARFVARREQQLCGCVLGGGGGSFVWRASPVGQRPLHTEATGAYGRVPLSSVRCTLVRCRK